MATMTGVRPVAKKKPASSQVRLASDVAELASIVAAYEGSQVVDLISEILRPVLQRRHAKHVEDAARRLTAEEESTRKKGE